MTDSKIDKEIFPCRMYSIGRNHGKAEKVQEATELLEEFLKEYYRNPIDDFEKGFVYGVRRAMGIIKDGGWE